MKGGEAVEGWGWARKVQVVGKSPLQPSPVVKMVWSNEQRTFAVETYFSRSHSIAAVQRTFRTRYQIPPRDRVLDRKSILLWVENFRGTGNVSKKKEEDGHGPLEHQRTSRLSDGPFCSLPGALQANIRPPLASQIVLFVEFFTKTCTSILTRWLLFKNLHNRTALTLRRRIKSHLLFAGIISSPFSPR